MDLEFYLLLVIDVPRRAPSPGDVGGPNGPHSKFLKEYGPQLLERLKPKAIVVFSAHWETHGAIQVSDNTENPLYYDYGGFPKSMYNLNFKSRGSSEVSSRVVDLLTKGGIKTKMIKNVRGLDHGVFVPFVLMFPSQFEIPIIQVSISSNLDPHYHLAIGKALTPLRDEGVLIISGGLTIHTFDDGDAWNPLTANPGYLDFETQIKSGVTDSPTPIERNDKLIRVTSHPFLPKSTPHH
ncbi:hypothetical protein BASA60_002645 [Batrachochytrium salamandrivorans]|nr:hypothetical protein BASA60_002645 [Batrachochytrium salamandrivorans]